MRFAPGQLAGKLVPHAHACSRSISRMRRPTGNRKTRAPRRAMVPVKTGGPKILCGTRRFHTLVAQRPYPGGTTPASHRFGTPAAIDPICGRLEAAGSSGSERAFRPIPTITVTNLVTHRPNPWFQPPFPESTVTSRRLPPTATPPAPTVPAPARAEARSAAAQTPFTPAETPPQASADAIYFSGRGISVTGDGIFVSADGISARADGISVSGSAISDTWTGIFVTDFTISEAFWRNSTKSRPFSGNNCRLSGIPPRLAAPSTVTPGAERLECARLVGAFGRTRDRSMRFVLVPRHRRRKSGDKSPHSKRSAPSHAPLRMRWPIHLERDTEAGARGGLRAGGF